MQPNHRVPTFANSAVVYEQGYGLLTSKFNITVSKASLPQLGSRTALSILFIKLLLIYAIRHPKVHIYSWLVSLSKPDNRGEGPG